MSRRPKQRGKFQNQWLQHDAFQTKQAEEVAQLEQLPDSEAAKSDVNLQTTEDLSIDDRLNRIIHSYFKGNSVS